MAFSFHQGTFVDLLGSPKGLVLIVLSRHLFRLCVNHATGTINNRLEGHGPLAGLTHFHFKILERMNETLFIYIHLPHSFRRAKTTVLQAQVTF